MHTFWVLLVAGITSGAVYGLLAVAICLTYRVSKVINAAIGELMVLGALIASSLIGRGWPLAIAVVVGVGVVGLVAAAFSGIILRPAIKAKSTMSQLLLVTFSLSILLQGVMLVAYGRDIHSAPAWIGGDGMTIGGVVLQPQRLLILAATLALGTGLVLYFSRSVHGRAMTATSQNPVGAALVGISVSRFRDVAFVGTAVIAALLGCMLIPITPFVYNAGLPLALVGMVGATLARFVNIGVAMAAGIVIGVLEQMIARYVSADLQTSLVYIVLTVLMLAVPSAFATAKARA
ncbi:MULTISPECIES: branched-chain amino acid ABC transporter permease [unclassified Nocardioides]|uniref:branched-chain amino acid ABC transporter permease n=1 Tax=unclassified Nocardioides TaxID=2615069 RepID=UPI000056FCEA|nr:MULTISPECIES: branched-chain amino acid ABC transporter permease [unclassified Nocardioides]ABL81656.1 amino acid/amide ABC transporter membrane protein 1, HAAT family [Nocardioides sp. JS614]